MKRSSWRYINQCVIDNWKEVMFCILDIHIKIFFDTLFSFRNKEVWIRHISYLKEYVYFKRVEVSCKQECLDILKGELIKYLLLIHGVPFYVRKLFTIIHYFCLFARTEVTIVLTSKYKIRPFTLTPLIFSDLIRNVGGHHMSKYNY